MDVDLGATWSSPAYVVRGSAGQLGDASAVIYTITGPAGTVAASGSAAHTSTGKYSVDYVPGLAGRYEVLVTATGGVLGTLVRTWGPDVFTVAAADPTGFVSVDDALRHMRASGIVVDADDQDQLAWLVSVACDAVERDLDAVLTRRTVTARYDGGRSRIRLRKAPLSVEDGGSVTVTGVTENGTALTEGVDYFVQQLGWMLVRGSRTVESCWSPGTEVVQVTYVPNVDPVPRIARKVALNGVRRMWHDSQQMPHPALDDDGADAAVYVAVGTLTPLELDAYDSLRGPGF